MLTKFILIIFNFFYFNATCQAWPPCFFVKSPRAVVDFSKMEHRFAYPLPEERLFEGQRLALPQNGAFAFLKSPLCWLSPQHSYFFKGEFISFVIEVFQASHRDAPCTQCDMD